MVKNRIYFHNNPWPEGHPINEFSWTSYVSDGNIWFNIHLKSADYYSERPIEDDENIDYISDWVAPPVWYNFHSCTLSSTYWNNGGFKVCSLEEYTPDFIENIEFGVDANPEPIEELDDLAFHLYLLGHDAAAKHRIKFERIPNSNLFNIIWSGKIALAYVGDYEFKYSFHTEIESVEFPTPTISS